MSAASSAPNTLRILGMMSGTSADGIDVALLSLGPSGPGQLLGYRHSAYSPSLREASLDAAHGPLSVEEAARLDRRLGRAYARAALQALERLGQADAIAFHGQTLRHQPGGEEGFTLQIGSAAELALASGLTIVHNFRAADVVAGGQGAPLVPPYHQLLFGASEPRAVLNLGGIANLTWIPGQGGAGSLCAFDTGPGNALLDGAAALLSGGRLLQDRGGAWAARGQEDTRQLARWLSWDFFQKPPPKSAGRAQFGAPLVSELWRSWAGSPADFLATLTALTAASVALALRRWTPGAPSLWVFGGGAENPTLMAKLASYLDGVAVERGARLSGVPSQALEAMAFAWLGAQCLAGRALPLGSVTGQSRPVILGEVLPGRAWPGLLERLSRWR